VDVEAGRSHHVPTDGWAALLLPSHPRDHLELSSRTQIAQAFRPLDAACSFLPFLRVITGRKISL